jgi:single-strand DNA-binding protein
VRIVGTTRPGRADQEVDVAGVPEVSARNEVSLVGRVSAPPEERALPSGDLLLAWRGVVDRPPPRRTVPEGVRTPTTDTFDCVAFSSGVRRTAGALQAGDVVRVEGALRRRFWRAGAATNNRTEVEVAAVKRLTRAQASR